MKSHGYSEKIKSTQSNEHKTELEVLLSERLKSIPEALGIRVNEESQNVVLKKDGDFEIRRYQNQVLAEVTLKALEFDEFREVAGYDAPSVLPFLRRNEVMIKIGNL